MKTAAFLDFDGVICDSILECFVSSYIAYYKNVVKKMPDSLPADIYRRFKTLRPYIRRGADYLLLHKILNEGTDCESQNEFDRILKKNGQELSDTFHNEFYDVRERMIIQEREYWLSLNKIYQGLEEGLRQWAHNGRIIILSTKKTEFIHEILLHSGIDWPVERIIYSGKENKSEIIKRMLNVLDAGRAFFVEDQIDHLDNIQSPLIEGCLASWGYVQEDWLSRPGICVLDIHGFLEKMKREF